MDQTTTNSNQHLSISNVPNKENINSNNMAYGLSTSYLVAIGLGAFFALLILVFAIYKYRNRDEGTYTIDETKNYGPFAELDVPLNGHANGGGILKNKNSKSSRNKRKGHEHNNNNNNINKEWYV
jgi:hypothetical protein